MRQLGVSTTGSIANLKNYIYTLSHVQPKNHPMQNYAQTKSSTATGTASLDHHPHNPALSQGLTGSVNLPTDSVINISRRIYMFMHLASVGGTMAAAPLLLLPL